MGDLPGCCREFGKSQRPREECLSAAALVSASTMPSTISSMKSWFSPSPITRITGSVPDARMISRPCPSRRCHRLLDRGFHLGVLQRLAVAVAHVLHHLRQRIEAVAHFRHRPAVLLHHREHLQRGDEAVAGRRIVRHDDVAGLLAAEIDAALAHVLEHVAVADRRARERKTEALQVALEAEIRHHGRRPRPAWTADCPPASSPPPRRGTGRRRPRGPSRPRSRRGRRRRRARCRCRRASRAPWRRAPSGAVEPQSLLMLKPSGSTPTREHLRAELPQRLGRDPIGGAVGAVDHHAHAVELHRARQRALGEFDVAVLHAVDAPGAADLLRAGEPLGRDPNRPAPRSASRSRRRACSRPGRTA